MQEMRLLSRLNNQPSNDFSRSLLRDEAQNRRACIIGGVAQTDKNFYERYCESLDNRIDELVFNLYDLTDEEKRLVKV